MELKMEDRNKQIIKIMFILVILIGFGLRVINLGDAALGEMELHWTLQALSVSGGEPVQISGNSFYVFVTGMLFNVFGSSEFFARLMPAILGTVLVAIPFFFRKHLGHRAALLISLGLAIDPGLVSLSRQAGSDISAVVLLALAFVFWSLEKDIWVGVMLALSLLSGSSTIYGLIVIVIAFVLFKSNNKNVEFKFDQGRTKKTILPLAVTLLIAGTWFSKYPSGLASFGNGIQYIGDKFTTSTDLTVGMILFSLVAFQPLMLSFGLIGAFSKQITGIIPKYLKWWLIVALALLLISPGRQAADLVWVIIPMCVLAGLAMQKFLFSENSLLGWVEYLLMAIILVFGIFGYFNLVNVLNYPTPAGANELIDSLLQFRFSDWANYDATVHSYIVRWMILPSIPAIIAMTTFIFSAFWGKDKSVKGLGWGVFIFLSAFSLSLSWRVSVSSPKAEDIWNTDHSVSERANLKEWIEWFGVINSGHLNELDIVVEDDSDQVLWQMRGFTNVTFGSGTAEIMLPEIAVTAEDDMALQKFGTYSMQTITIAEKTEMDSDVYENSLRWFFWNDEQAINKKVNLWVRHDLFPSD